MEMLMALEKEREAAARAGFKRMMLWICVVAVFMVGGALLYLTAGSGEVSPHMVIAAILGVFLSVVIGAGLMAAVFFSSKSGHDEEAGAKRSDEDGQDRGA